MTRICSLDTEAVGDQLTGQGDGLLPGSPCRVACGCPGIADGDYGDGSGG